jgi:NDP-sugar pyrophosphorylase family protein
MTPSFFRTYPRACAVVLAASKGSRLFPMTTADIPKHLLPVAGTASILRLLESLSFFSQIVIAIAADDSKTLPTLEQVATILSTPDEQSLPRVDNDVVDTHSEMPQYWKLESNTVRGQLIYLIKLSEDCFASADGLRQIEETQLIHPSTRIVVFPGDLVLLTKEINLDALIRPPADTACVAVLVDVLEQDEHGQPVKESSKVGLRK